MTGRGGTFSGERPSEGIVDAAVPDLVEPPAEVVVRGRPEARDLDLGAGDGPALEVDDPALDPRAGCGRRRGSAFASRGWVGPTAAAPFAAPGALVAASGSSARQASDRDDAGRR